MENSSKKLFFKFGFVFMVVLNLVILGLLFFHHPQNKERMLPAERGGKDPIVKELHFNASQEQKFNVLRDAHRSKMRSLKEENKNLRSALFATLKTEAITESAKKLFIEKISKNQEEMELITFEHFKKVRALGDEEQKQKFDEMIDKIINHLMGDHPRPGRRMPPPFKE
jgi:periplasmic protein CpxP/Spy